MLQVTLYIMILPCLIMVIVLMYLWSTKPFPSLHTASPGAPKQDTDLLQSLMPVQPTPTLSSVPPSSSMTASPLPSVSADPGGKSLKKLKKKLAAIEELKKRQAAGETLEENQVS